MNVKQGGDIKAVIQPHTTKDVVNLKSKTQYMFTYNSTFGHAQGLGTLQEPSSGKVVYQITPVPIATGITEYSVTNHTRYNQSGSISNNINNPNPQGDCKSDRGGNTCYLSDNNLNLGEVNFNFDAKTGA